MKKLILMFFFLISMFTFTKENDYKFIMSGNFLGKIDINYSTEEAMFKTGIAESYIRKILEYREIKGNIENIKELERISGIGSKTCKKLEKYFTINDIPKTKTLYINIAEDKIFKYYGFDKKEIKKIRKYLSENGSIKSNIILQKIISKNKYEKYKDVIKFNNY